MYLPSNIKLYPDTSQYFHSELRKFRENFKSSTKIFALKEKSRPNGLQIRASGFRETRDPCAGYAFPASEKKRDKETR